MPAEGEGRVTRYADYLQSPEWAVVRRLALEQAGYACRLCGAPQEESRLDVHHRTYERLGAELLADVIVLCSSCHCRHHDCEKRDDLRDLECYVSALAQVVDHLKLSGREIPPALQRDHDAAIELLAICRMGGQ